MKKVILFLTLTLFSCHQIHEGKIIGKIIEPERQYTYSTQLLVGKVWIPQFHTVHDDEDFILVVEGVLDKDTIKRMFYVNESQYKCMKIGDYFNDSISCSTEDFNNTELN